MKYIQGRNIEVRLSAFYKALHLNELDNYQLSREESLGFLSRIGRLQVFAICETEEEIAEYKRKVYGAPWVVWGPWERSLPD